jgi:Domain of unknown function (DUF2760)
VSPLPFFTRLWFAWLCSFRVLFDGDFAARAFALTEPSPKPEPEPKPKLEPKPEPKKAAEPSGPPPTDAALQLLALLQREGRFVDFLEEDVASFPDADIGAAARVVHAGCRKALRDHVKLEPVRTEEEGTKLTLESGFRSEEVKLTGNVAGKGPYAGTLRHRGWRAQDVTLPTAVEGHDARIIAQAEVEL